MTVLAAIEVYPGWYHVEWLYPGMHKIAAVRQLKKVEKEIQEKGGKGWLMESHKTHTDMHPIIKKLGGKIYQEDEEHFYFSKEVIPCVALK